MGSREQPWPYMSSCDVNGVTWPKCAILIGREKFLLRSDWLRLVVALMTTYHPQIPFSIPLHFVKKIKNKRNLCRCHSKYALYRLRGCKDAYQPRKHCIVLYLTVILQDPLMRREIHSLSPLFNATPWKQRWKDELKGGRGRSTKWDKYMKIIHVRQATLKNIKAPACNKKS